MDGRGRARISVLSRRGHGRGFSHRSSRAETMPQQQAPVTVLMKKPQESTSPSPSPAPPIATKKEDLRVGGIPAQPKIAMPETPAVNPLTSPPLMKASMKLMDPESLKFSESCLEFLLDHPECLVVGCIGLQGVGKSTILSLLCGGKLNDSKSFPFMAETPEQLEMSEHCTNGIRIFASFERVIFLDMQPLMSPSVMDRLAQKEKKYSFDYGCLHTTIEIQALQMVALFLNICHVVLVVQDFVLDPNIIRLVQAAEMLKPYGLSPEDPESFPHVVFVHNKVHPDEFQAEAIIAIQRVYRDALSKSQLRWSSGLHMRIPNVRYPKTEDIVNLFFLPNFSDDRSNTGKNGFGDHQNFLDMIRELRCILSAERHPFTHNPLTERNWFHYSAKMWEHIRKSGYFHEYSRQLEKC